RWLDLLAKSGVFITVGDHHEVGDHPYSGDPLAAGNLVGIAQCGAHIIESVQYKGGPSGVVMHPTPAMQGFVGRVRLCGRGRVQRVVVGVDRAGPAAIPSLRVRTAAARFNRPAAISGPTIEAAPRAV